MNAPAPQAMTNVDIQTIMAALGFSKSTACDRAIKEAWTFIEQAGRGGKKRLYPIASLPKYVQTALDTQRMVELGKKDQEMIEGHARAGRLIAKNLREDHENAERDAKLTRQQAGLEIMARWPTLTDNQVARMQGRHEIVQAYSEWIKLQQGKASAGATQGKYKARKTTPGNKTLNTFAASYNTTKGTLVSDKACAAISKISGRNLRRWVEGFALLGFAGLLDKKDGKELAGHGKIEDQEQLKTLVVGMLVEYPHVSNKHIEDTILTRFGKVLADVHASVADAHEDGLLARPSVHAIKRFRDEWEAKHKSVYLALKNPDKWKNEQMLAFGDAAGDVTHPNYRWEIDSTPGDLLLLDPDSASGVSRYSALLSVDVWGRRGKILVSKTSKSIALGSLMRRCILDWGMPERRKADNGADYQANYLNRFFDAIGCEREDCDPFAGWQKPHVERFGRTFNHDLVELLPGYVGHSVAERKELEARASFSERLFKKDGVLEVSMTAADFQQFCDDWSDKVYARNLHSDLGMTPFAKNASWDKPVKRIKDERALDVLLAPLAGSNKGQFSLQKKGIRINKAWYISPELGRHAVGDRFKVSQDVADMGRVFVFDAKGEFVCIAQNHEWSGISPAEVACATKAIQRHEMKEQKAVLKKVAKSANVKNIAAEIMKRRIEESDKVTMMPHAGTAHTTAAIKAAGLAARAGEGIQPSAEADTLREEAAAAMDQKVVAHPSAALNVSIVAGMTAEQKYDKWMELDAKNKRDGDLVDAVERNWHKVFTRSTTYRAQKAMRENKLGEQGK